jgi:hypothetical protein
MAGPIKTFTATGKAAIDLVAAILIAIGALLVIGSCVYRVFVRPEWTFEQALQALWPFFLAGAVSLMLGWLVDRAER